MASYLQSKRAAVQQPAAQDPLTQYNQVANNRSAEDNQFYANQQQQIANQETQSGQTQGQPGPTQSPLPASGVQNVPPAALPTGGSIMGALQGGMPQPPAPASPDPFAEIGGGVQLPDGGWVPANHPLAIQHQQTQQLVQPTAAAQVGTGPNGTVGPAGVMQPAPTDLVGAIEAILRRGEGGGLSPDIINSRVNSARDDMNRARMSQGGQLQAMLSDRGLLGSGAEATGLGRIEEDLASIYGQQVNDIYGDEAQRADQRFIDALGMLTGYRSNQEGLANQRGIASMNNDTDRLNIESGYNLGQGRLGLDRELGLLNHQSGQVDDILQLVSILLQGAGQSQEGYN